MRELRRRMIQDMNLAGFTDGTQRSYINAIRQLAGHYMTSPDLLTEKQVQDYVFYLRDEKRVAKGTFQSYFQAMKFLYDVTLNYDWPLFTKKKGSPPSSETFAGRPQRCRLPSVDCGGTLPGLSRMPGDDVRLRTPLE